MSEKPKHEVHHEPHGQFGPEVVCLCGWRKRHKRAKVRQVAAAKHLRRYLAPSQLGAES